MFNVVLYRCLCDASQMMSTITAEFSPGNPKYTELLEKDLVMNIYKDGKWGSYRHVAEPFGEFARCISQLVSDRTHRCLRGMSQLFRSLWADVRPAAADD
ncbi:hypothetical protein HPB48_018769 [Haemaphysalis longicornis]|uniref:Fatty acid synthase pseudo-KR domain-containing protein n=1 Tax=Haemaphysalis longicornis TaxID=44386 RepID=A0A9J6GCY1_HAELO|nr:hypothetical protein HPB48_018769 [Haemaphysalis longicornis]